MPIISEPQISVSDGILLESSTYTGNGSPSPEAIGSSSVQTINMKDISTVEHGMSDLNVNAHNPTEEITNIEHDFSHIYIPAPALASSRYNRQMLIPAISLPGQQRILSAKVLVIGLGGLGSPAALYLAGAGIGTLGLLDDDQVERSNLHRQIVHREDSVQRGLSKVESALRGCREINSEIEIIGHEMRFAMDVKADREAREKIVDVVSRYDIVLDCTDNPTTRYLISDLCVLLGKTLVSGAAQRLEGQVLVLNYQIPGSETSSTAAIEQEQSNGIPSITECTERGPCYRCVFPTPPSPEMVRGCGEIGILGPVVGTIGTLMASEALRLIVKGPEETRKPTMLLYNAWPTDPKSMFRTIGLRGRRKDCLACGEDTILAEKGLRKITQDEVLEGRLDYIAFCGLLEDVRILTAEQRISIAEFLGITTAQTGIKRVGFCKKPLFVDIREPSEVAMGPKIPKSVNVPLTHLLRRDHSIDELEDLLQRGNYDAMLFVCQKGNDSQVAAQKLLDARMKRGGSVVESVRKASDPLLDIFIGDIAGGYVAIEKAITTSSTLSKHD